MSKFTLEYFENLYNNKTENLEETCNLIFKEIDEKLDSMFNGEILSIYEKDTFQQNFKIRFDERKILDSVSTLGSSFYEKEIKERLKKYNNNILILKLTTLAFDENIRNEDFLDLEFNISVKIPPKRTKKN